MALLALALGLTASAQSSGSSGSSDQSTTGTTGGTSGSGMSGSTSGSSDTYGATSGTSAASASDSTMGTTTGDWESSLKGGDKRFITKAAESSSREVALSQLAAERASNPQVRTFAQQLLSQHQQMNQQLVQLAQQKGVTLENLAALSATGLTSGTMAGTSGSTSTTGTGMSGTSTGGSSGMATNDTGARTSTGLSSGSTGTSAGNTHLTSDRHYRSLAKKTGADFDKEYMSRMVDEHEKDVELFQKAAEDASDPAVKAFASQHVASLQGHLEHAKNLSNAAAE